jgi:hypothetical protein
VRIAAIAALLDRYVAAVNAGDPAALQALFAKPYALKGGREAFPDLRIPIDRILTGDKIAARKYMERNARRFSRHRANWQADYDPHPRGQGRVSQPVAFGVAQYRFGRSGL